VRGKLHEVGGRETILNAALATILLWRWRASRRARPRR